MNEDSLNVWIQRVAAAAAIGLLSWAASQIRESRAFEQGRFLPHGMCYLWQPAVIWSHAISDSVIAVSYIVITIFLSLMVKSGILLVEAHRIATPSMFVWFAVFIGGCGLTHAMDTLNIWTHLYWVDEGIRGPTAIASAVTAFNIAVLWRRLTLERLIREMGKGQ